MRNAFCSLEAPLRSAVRGLRPPWPPSPGHVLRILEDHLFTLNFLMFSRAHFFMIWCDFKLSKRPQMEAQRHPKTYFSESSENSVFEQPSFVFAYFLCCRLMLAADFSLKIITQKEVQEKVTQTHYFDHFGCSNGTPKGPQKQSKIEQVTTWAPTWVPRSLRNPFGHPF